MSWYVSKYHRTVLPSDTVSWKHTMTSVDTTKVYLQTITFIHNSNGAKNDLDSYNITVYYSPELKKRRNELTSGASQTMIIYSHVLLPFPPFLVL